MIRTLALLGNEEKPQLADAVARCVHAANSAGVELLLHDQLEGHVPAAGRPALASFDDILARADAIACLGGDGTFLRVAAEVGDRRMPLVGINLGSLGFLAEVRVEEIDEAIGQLATGSYEVERRRRVSVVLWREGEVLFRSSALNEVAINMGPVLRALDLEVRVDGTHLARTLADGLLVASPTGSTAYNLSAGGPILDPALDVVLLTPICPHTLAVRPLVLDYRSNIEVELRGDSEGIVTADGREGHPLRAGDRLSFPPGGENCHFIRLPRRNLFRIIQQKLRWGGPARELLDEPGAGA